METKKCSKCGEVKELNYFYLQEGGKLGVRGECKECTKKDHSLNYPYIKKQKYPCLICGHGISKENNLCTRCKVKRGKFSTIKCDWCNEIKDSVCFSHGSKANYGNGKKIFCIDCTEKYYPQIRLKMAADKRKRDFSKKHFDLKNEDSEKFKKYLLKSNNLQHKYMKEIDYESYELALEIKKQAYIIKEKRHNKKRNQKRKTDKEWNEKQNKRRAELWANNKIRINFGDGIKKNLNIKTCPDEMKEAIQGLLELRKKNNFIKEIQND